MISREIIFFVFIGKNGEKWNHNSAIMPFYGLQMQKLNKKANIKVKK